MSIRKHKDGVYVIRYYADGTKNSPQRQETLRGVTYAEAVRIYKERVAAASRTKPRNGRTDRRARAQTAGTFLQGGVGAFRLGIRRRRGLAALCRRSAAIWDRSRWCRLEATAALRGRPQAHSEATAKYRERLRSTLPLFLKVLQRAVRSPRSPGKTRRADGSAFSVRELQRAFAVASRLAGLRQELTPKSLRRSLSSWPASESDRLRRSTSNPWRIFTRLRVSLLDRARQTRIASISLEHDPDSVEQLPRTGVAQRADQRGGQMKGTRRILATAIVLVARCGARRRHSHDEASEQAKTGHRRFTFICRRGGPGSRAGCSARKGSKGSGDLGRGRRGSASGCQCDSGGAGQGGQASGRAPFDGNLARGAAGSAGGPHRRPAAEAAAKRIKGNTRRKSWRRYRASTRAIRSSRCCRRLCAMSRPARSSRTP